MKIILEKRQEHSARMAILSPLIAIGLTILVGGIIFAMRGLNPFSALFVYFIIYGQSDGIFTGYNEWSHWSTWGVLIYCCNGELPFGSSGRLMF